LISRLFAVGVCTYTYDRQGNQASKTNTVTGERWDYKYDVKNELIEAKQSVTGNDLSSFQYDASYAGSFMPYMITIGVWDSAATVYLTRNFSWYVS
jgi:hypothetical protein